MRRGRLKELGIGRATFSAAGSELPVPVGATVQIPSDKKIKAEVTIKNTGSGSFTKDLAVLVYYAAALSDPSGDPRVDDGTWSKEAKVLDFDLALSVTLNPGDSYTFTDFGGVAASNWDENTEIDAGVVIIGADPGAGQFTEYYDSLKITDAVKIIAPTLRVEITDVSFSEA